MKRGFAKAKPSLANLRKHQHGILASGKPSPPFF